MTSSGWRRRRRRPGAARRRLRRPAAGRCSRSAPAAAQVGARRGDAGRRRPPHHRAGPAGRPRPAARPRPSPPSPACTRHRRACCTGRLTAQGVPRHVIDAPAPTATPTAPPTGTPTSRPTAAVSAPPAATTADLAAAEVAAVGALLPLLGPVTAAEPRGRSCRSPPRARRPPTSSARRLTWPAADPLPPAAAVPLLADTRAAAYAMQVVAAQSTGDQRTRALATRTQLDAREAQLLALAGASAPPAPLGYALPFPVTDAGAAGSAGEPGAHHPRRRGPAAPRRGGRRVHRPSSPLARFLAEAAAIGRPWGVAAGALPRPRLPVSDASAWSPRRSPTGSRPTRRPRTRRPADAARYAVTGAEWLRRLPRLLGDLLDEWRLTPAGAGRLGPLRRRRAGGPPRPGRRRSRCRGPTTRRSASTWPCGTGTAGARYACCGPTRTGSRSCSSGSTPPTSAAIPDEEACEVVGTLLDRLRAPAIARTPTLSAYVARQLAKPPPLDVLPRRFVDQGRRLAAELASDPGVDAYLLHSDLHYENVLRGERQPWLAIDPKPMAGDRAFEVAPVLWNRVDELGTGSAFRWNVRRRLEVVCAAAGIDEDRAKAWTIVRAVDNAGDEPPGSSGASLARGPHQGHERLSRRRHGLRAVVCVCPTASAPPRAPTCCSTPTTLSTGGSGSRPPSRRPAGATCRSCCPWATRPATGATSWPTSRSRTPRWPGSSTPGSSP